ncbi:uncharacterized protein LOC116305738 isoform X5 [Actinia tenebrosa]|uniref:Uncharacterized protein LOC116305738 isoform X5 n=1 Tax=Actinia tenebrosa TaxID=6105 RepID=A0A6P8IWR9_ACTTE|nr:uncharacterized protein LOC116305738 isoform X5 [Actinia tenebrosa]
MISRWNGNSCRDLPVMDKVELSRKLSSELMPNSAPLDHKSRSKSVMFSCSLPVCSSDRKDARKQKEKERKKSLSKGRDRYTIVKGLAGGPDGVSFESVTKKKHFLRVRENNILIVEPYDDSEEYRKQSTYIPLQDMWYFGYIVFESLVEPAHFIRRCSDQLVLQKYENTPFFKEDASFKLTRKRCIACVKIGSRVWARIEKGCFLRGTVIAVDDLVHIELENGNRVKHKKITTEGDCAYVPDIVPHSLEIDIGTRVLARWFNRHDSYYPATVTAIRRNLFSVRYDDGDKGTNNINEIRILKQPEVEGGANLPSWSSLDGLPRVGGLCIDSTSSDQSTTEETIDSQETPQHEDWSPYPRDMSIPEQRLYENQSELPRELDRDADFGYENNLQYLTPNIQPLYHAPVIRNVSQVKEEQPPPATILKNTPGNTKITIPCQTTKRVTLQTTPQQMNSISPTVSPRRTTPASPRLIPKITQLVSQVTQRVTEGLTSQDQQNPTETNLLTITPRPMVPTSPKMARAMMTPEPVKPKIMKCSPKMQKKVTEALSPKLCHRNTVLSITTDSKQINFKATQAEENIMSLTTMQY